MWDGTVDLGMEGLKGKLRSTCRFRTSESPGAFSERKFLHQTFMNIMSGRRDLGIWWQIRADSHRRDERCVRKSTFSKAPGPGPDSLVLKPSISCSALMTADLTEGRTGRPQDEVQTRQRWKEQIPNLGAAMHMAARHMPTRNAKQCTPKVKTS